MELLIGMTEKELRARYKHTVFGFIWIVANPLLQMLVIGFIFPFFIRERIDNYNYYLFTGLLVWNFFSLSLTKATPSIVNERSLIKKARFPRSVIPLSIILSNLVHLVLALALLVIPLLFLGTLMFPRILFIIPAFFLLILFTLGASLLTCALNVRFRDINFFVQALLILWFYATPIVYTLGLIPRSAYLLWRLNPLTAIFQLFQYALLGSAPPGLLVLSSNLISTTLIIVLGILVFQKESKNFDDWV